MREEASFHMFFLKKMTSSYLEKEKFWVIMKKEKLLQTLYLKLRNTATIFLEATDIIPQPAFTCSKLITKTLEQGVKHFQS